MARLAKAVVVVLVLAAVAAGATYWYSTRRDNGAAYQTVPVKKIDITATITATGTIVPEDVVDVGAQVNGQIASFGKDKDGKPIDYRSTLDEGMVLARIDEALYAADVATSRAQLQQAQAQVRLGEANREQARAKLEQATRDWDRAQRLGPSAALAQADYDAAKSAYEQGIANVAVSEAQIGQAQASVAMAQASVDRSERNLAYCTISSPVNGVIIDKRVEIGQTVVASFNAPSLFLIAKDLRRMQVLVQVNEADIGSVHPGQTVSFTVDAYPGQDFRGEVRKVRLNASMTQNVVTYTVEIVTDNSDQRLLPYLTANVRFIVAEHDSVLAVPNAALRFSPRQAPQSARNGNGGTGGPPGRRGGDAGAPGGGPKVWVMDNGDLRPVGVKTGISDGTFTEVQTPDLAEGTQVVLGEQVAPAAGPGGASPFTPQMFRGRGR